MVRQERSYFEKTNQKPKPIIAMKAIPTIAMAAPVTMFRSRPSANS